MGRSAFLNGDDVMVNYEIYQVFARMVQPVLDHVGPFLEEDADATLDAFWEQISTDPAPWSRTAPNNWIYRSLSTALQRQVRIFFYVRDMLL